MKLMTRLFTFMLIFASVGLFADEVLMEKTFNTGKNGLLYVKSLKGTIEVEASTDNEVRVRVEYRDRGWGRGMEKEEIIDELNLKIEKDGKNVNVTTRSGGNNWGWGNKWNKLQLRYIIEVPSEYNVDLNTAGGSIAVGDLNGELDAETSGGSMKFGNINGPVNASTAGGSISLDDCNGEVRVRTAGGSISIGEVDGNVDARTAGGSISIEKSAGTVNAQTSGGSISVDEVMGDITAETSGGSVSARITKQPQGDCRLTTSGGSVTVYLASDVKMDLNAKSGWGNKVYSDFDVMVKGGNSRDKSSLRGEINGGGPELYLRTSSGRVKVLEL